MEEFERLLSEIDEFGEWPDFDAVTETEEAAYLEYA
jgi:hypothetical protein